MHNPHCSCFDCLRESFFTTIRSQLPIVILGPDRSEETKPVPNDRYSRFDLTMSLQGNGRRTIKVNDVHIIGCHDPKDARQLMDAIGIILSMYKKHLIATGRMAQ